MLMLKHTRINETDISTSRKMFHALLAGTGQIWLLATVVSILD